MCLLIAVKYPNNVLAKGNHLGFEYMVIHNDLGFRCGYVKVEKDHPWFGKDYDNIEASVHGGLTFAEYDVPCDKNGPDDGFWIGFDCAHSGDAQDLTLPHTFVMPGNGTVKSQEYVENECKRLCEQAKEAAAPPIII